MDIYRTPLKPSLCPREKRETRPLTLAAVQLKWLASEQAHHDQIEEGVAAAASAGAEIVFLPELTLSRYPADTQPSGAPDETAESLEDGPTTQMLKALSARYDLMIHGSLFEKTGAEDGRGFNTAVVVNPAGHIVAKTRKTHIPVTAGYYEDKYFAEGPAEDAFPVHPIELDSGSLGLGLPTCWDEWFPEVARAYGLGGADVLCYPTAIGSEPDYPDFDTEPLWRQTIVGHAIANGLFIVVPNRFGGEGLINFYGSSFIVDPFGRLLAQAPRDKAAVLIADIDLAQRDDWLYLFPFFATRRPDAYQALTAPRVNPRTEDGEATEGGIPGISR